jgi:hypothetical protein
MKALIEQLSIGNRQNSHISPVVSFASMGLGTVFSPHKDQFLLLLSIFF